MPYNASTYHDQSRVGGGKAPRQDVEAPTFGWGKGGDMVSLEQEK